MLYSRLQIATVLCLVSLLMTACSGLMQSPQPAQAPPLRSDRFALPPEGTDLVGQLQVARARHEDTLPDIARRYDLGYEEIVAANPGVDPWLPGEGTEILLPTQFVLPPVARRGVVLNLASMRLFYFPEPQAGAAAEVVTYPIGIGREGWETPLGEFRITEKREQPTWTVPASVRREHAEAGDPLPAVVPPGPDNPLGDYAMRLSLPSYLIHGTNQPWGVGMRVSHGCVRLYPEDIARLFPEVPLGTPVLIVNEPYLAGWREGQLYLEAHAPLAEDERSPGEALERSESAMGRVANGKGAALDRERANAVASAARGIPLPVLSGSPVAAAVIASAPRVTSTPPWAPVDYSAGESAETEREPGPAARAQPQAEPESGAIAAGGCDGRTDDCTPEEAPAAGISWGVPAAEVTD